MDIIQGHNSLRQLLEEIKNKQVTIVTAFASKTVTTIDKMLKNGNELTLIVGTIHYFSDPVFIRHCTARAKEAALTLFVDFRGEDSIHWKLYLIAPDTVVIGSPNLTTTGLSMRRDTAVWLQDTTLYTQYQALVDELCLHPKVVTSISPEFRQHLADYEAAHLPRIIRRTNEPVQETEDFVSWANRDDTQILPLYIWEFELTDKDQAEFEQEIEPLVQAEHSLETEPKPKIILEGVYEHDPEELWPYQDNEWVLIV